MKQFKMFLNIAKEKEWLNVQLQKGYRCTNISSLGIYTFERTNKQYVIRLDCQDYLSKEKLAEYKGIYEDFGWTYIRGFWIGGTRYWQKEQGNQDHIFSDRQSKVHYYKRLMGYSIGLGMLCLMIAFFQYHDSGLSGFYHDGLWAMEGSLFWKAFLFETPFVLLKLAPVFLFIFFSSSFIKTYHHYTELKEK